MNKEPLKIKKKENLKGEDGHKTFSIRIKEETVIELDKISNETNRTRNELINMFLEYSVNNWELEE